MSDEWNLFLAPPAKNNNNDSSDEAAEKILGKYKVMQPAGDKVIAVHNEKEYIIEIIAKPTASAMYSDIARRLSTVAHDNISNPMIEEDEENFYFVDNFFGNNGYSQLKAQYFSDGQDFDYINLIKCYLQIVSAIRYIHQKGFYHGNIKPENILIGLDEHAFLLDFGRSYLYSLLKNEPDKTFYAPEQIEKNEIYPESDIYSFGLCMLKLIVDNFEEFDFFERYKSYTDLEELFTYITDNYELEEVENELFLLSKQMLAENSSDRIDLIRVQKKLQDLLLQNQAMPTFAMQIMAKTLEVYRQNNGIDRYEELLSLQGKINGYQSF